MENHRIHCACSFLVSELVELPGDVSLAPRSFLPAKKHKETPLLIPDGDRFILLIGKARVLLAIL